MTFNEIGEQIADETAARVCSLIDANFSGQVDRRKASATVGRDLILLGATFLGTACFLKDAAETFGLVHKFIGDVVELARANARAQSGPPLPPTADRANGGHG